MSAFDLTQYNNINRMLSFKKNNTPSLYYDVENNLTYTTWCLSQYYTSSDQPKLYGPDFVVITYTYWHNEHSYDECPISPMMVIGHEYDKDIQENWHDAASYHKYDYDMDSDYDNY
jgi:hypothetical protein